MKEFKKHELETWNDQEEDRLELLAITKLRGKGAPKKKRVKDRECRTISGTREMLMRCRSQKRKEKVIDLFQQVFDILRYPRRYVQCKHIRSPASTRPFVIGFCNNTLFQGHPRNKSSYIICNYCLIWL